MNLEQAEQSGAHWIKLELTEDGAEWKLHKRTY